MSGHCECGCCSDRFTHDCPRDKFAWIKCSDRLPECGKAIIVFDGHEAFGSERQEIPGAGYVWDDWSRPTMCACEITHWMPMPENPTYQALLALWAKQRLGYMVLQSLKPSKIEWDTVKEDDPRSWPNWSTDLGNAGLNDVETQRVLNLVLEANCLDDAKLKKAREVFLVGQEPKPESSGLPTEPPNTESGVLASA